MIVQGGRKGWESGVIRAPGSARTGTEDDVPEGAGEGEWDGLAVRGLYTTDFLGMDPVIVVVFRGLYTTDFRGH